ncbi:MAG: hypothetical protein L6435_00340 [Anaerolineae bacterium]|nr:hypothetical protein [Anaerolineae bacterium]
MNSRERFLAWMSFGRADRAPRGELGYWGGTIRRWYEEGLPKNAGLPDFVAKGDAVIGEMNPGTGSRVRDQDVRDYFGFDKGIDKIWFNNLICPYFEEEVLEDHVTHVVKRTRRGTIIREAKDRAGLPGWVSGPVSNWEDWERLKAERLQPTLEGRLPADWTEQVARYKARDYPLFIGGPYNGFFGTLTDLVGREKLLYMYYDNPGLVKDMINYLAEFWIALYDEILDQADVDAASIWEDMCGKNGPLISPAAFREFMLPAYKETTSFFRGRGIKIILVDSDGNLWPLIPLWVEGGVTALYNFEVNAGMDVVEVRKAYPRLQMVGGLDKTKLAAGPEAIDVELETKVPFMLRSGGYWPAVDGNVDPDVSWENFCYYRRRLDDMIYEASKGISRLCGELAVDGA